MAGPSLIIIRRNPEADGDATSCEALAQLLGPVLDCFGAVLDDRELDGVGTGDLQAEVVLTVGPVDADEAANSDTSSCMATSWI